MATTKPKAIFVGPRKLGEVLENFYSRMWDFQPMVEKISDLWEGLSNNTVDRDIQVLIVVDIFFDETGRRSDFEELITTMGPHCFLPIINYKPILKEHMIESIYNNALNNNYDTNDIFYYFIDQNSPGPSMNAALRKFSEESKDDELVYKLTGIDRRRSAANIPAPQQNTSGSTSIQNYQAAAQASDYLGRVISVTSSKGGSGKSTVAITLAAYLSHASIESVARGIESKPLKVILVDLDVRDGQVGFLTNKSKPTVINLRSEGISEATLKKTIIPDDRLKCDILLAPKRPRHADDTPPSFYVNLIQELKLRYDVIILDTSVNYLDTLLEKVAYPMSNKIIFVTDIVRTSVYSMTRWIQEVTSDQERGGMGISKGKIGYVVNKALPDVAMTPDSLQKAALDLKMITSIPSQPKAIAHATNTNSMESLLKIPALNTAVRRIAVGVIGDKYKLAPIYTGR